MIQAITKQDFQVDERDITTVIEELQRVGLKPSPSWRLVKDGYGVLILPNYDTKKLLFTILTAQKVAEEYADILDQPNMAWVIDDLKRDGFEETYHRCFTGNKSSVRISESIRSGVKTYLLEIRGFNHAEIRGVLEKIGVDYSILDSILEWRSRRKQKRR
jgi:hypothetical protein